MFLWTRKIHFWQPWRRVFTEKPEYFPAKVRKQNFFRRILSPVRSSGYRKIRYDDPAEIFLPEVPNLLLELRKWIRINFFRKTNFAQTLPLDTWNAIWTTVMKYSRESFKKHGSKSKNDQKEQIFFSKK